MKRKIHNRWRHRVAAQFMAPSCPPVVMATVAISTTLSTHNGCCQDMKTAHNSLRMECSLLAGPGSMADSGATLPLAQRYLWSNLTEPLMATNSTSPPAPVPSRDLIGSHTLRLCTLSRSLARRALLDGGRDLIFLGPFLQGAPLQVGSLEHGIASAAVCAS